MILYKDWIAEQLKGKKVRFRCDCIVPLDVIGVVVGWSRVSDEIVYQVKVEGTPKIVRVGENTHNLMIEVF